MKGLPSNRHLDEKMKWTGLGLFLGVVFMATCNTSTAFDPLEPETVRSRTESNLNGFKFSGPCHTIKQRMTGNEISIECDQWRLKISKGQLFMNGLPYGPVKKGDQIQLMSEGSLFINRHPVSPSTEE